MWPTSKKELKYAINFSNAIKKKLELELFDKFCMKEDKAEGITSSLSTLLDLKFRERLIFWMHDFILWNAHSMDTHIPVIVTADTSLYGLGACILQQENVKWLPVAFCSRTLTPIEHRYPIVEKECLATWS